MQKFNITPSYIRLQYNLNGGTGWYLLNESQDLAFDKMPNQLKIDQSVQPFLIRNGAKNCLRGPQNNYKRFFTGLKATQFSQLYRGDNLNDRSSLLLIDLSHNKSLLTVFYFSEFKVLPRRLKSFIAFFKSDVIDKKKWQQF